MSKKRHSIFTRRHDKAVADYVTFMNDGTHLNFKAKKKKHYGHMTWDVDCGNDWPELRTDIKTTNRGFRHHRLIEDVEAKYHGVPVLPTRETHKRYFYVTIPISFWRDLLNIVAMWDDVLKRLAAECPDFLDQRLKIAPSAWRAGLDKDEEKETP